MGRIVIVKDFARALRDGTNVSDVNIDPGGGANITGEHFANPGDDSYPLTTDYAIAVDTLKKGGAAVVGYLDPINTPKAQVGDKRIYSRDGNGANIGEVWVKADGSTIIANSNGNIELKANGDVVINGVVISASGVVNSTDDIITTGDVKAGPLATDLVTHTHIGSPTAPLGAISSTGVPNP